MHFTERCPRCGRTYHAARHVGSYFTPREDKRFRAVTSWPDGPLRKTRKEAEDDDCRLFVEKWGEEAQP